MEGQEQVAIHTDPAERPDWQRCRQSGTSLRMFEFDYYDGRRAIMYRTLPVYRVPAGSRPHPWP